MLTRRILRAISLALLVYIVAMATGRAAEEDRTIYVMPEIPTDAEKILALKLAYELNGRSMNSFGRMIDLSGPQPSPPPPLTDELMPAPRKQDRKR
jgi:hypothetical protein